MPILLHLALAGLLLLLQATQARNIQAALSANIAGDVTQESLLIETNLNDQGFSTTLHVNYIDSSEQLSQL